MSEVGVTGSVRVGDARVGMEYGVMSVGVGVGTSARTGCPLTSTPLQGGDVPAPW